MYLYLENLSNVFIKKIWQAYLQCTPMNIIFFCLDFSSLLIWAFQSLTEAARWSWNSSWSLSSPMMSLKSHRYTGYAPSYNQVKNLWSEKAFGVISLVAYNFSLRDDYLDIDYVMNYLLNCNQGFRFRRIS